jgi:hypothetical protein
VKEHAPYFGDLVGTPYISIGLQGTHNVDLLFGLADTGGDDGATQFAGARIYHPGLGVMTRVRKTAEPILERSR